MYMFLLCIFIMSIDMCLLNVLVNIVLVYIECNFLFQRICKIMYGGLSETVYGLTLLIDNMIKNRKLNVWTVYMFLVDLFNNAINLLVYRKLKWVHCCVLKVLNIMTWWGCGKCVYSTSCILDKKPPIPGRNDWFTM